MGFKDLHIMCLKTTSSVTWSYLPVRNSGEFKNHLDSTDRDVIKGKIYINSTRYRRKEDEYISHEHLILEQDWNSSLNPHKDYQEPEKFEAQRQRRVVIVAFVDT